MNCLVCCAVCIVVRCCCIVYCFFCYALLVVYCVLCFGVLRFVVECIVEFDVVACIVNSCMVYIVF